MDTTSARWIGAQAQTPAVAAANERRVRRDFWNRFRRVAGRIPFAHDLLAAYFCAMDPATPARVRATLFGALAYFLLPLDMVPDMLAVVGFTDDATVLLAALSLVSAHIAPRHRQAAARALEDDAASPPAA